MISAAIVRPPWCRRCGCTRTSSEYSNSQWIWGDRRWDENAAPPSHWISWHEKCFARFVLRLIFFCHFRHTFGISLAKPRIPAFGNASFAHTKRSRFAATSMAMLCPELHVRFRAIIDFAFCRAKNEIKLERHSCEMQSLVSIHPGTFPLKYENSLVF